MFISQPLMGMLPPQLQQIVGKVPDNLPRIICDTAANMAHNVGQAFGRLGQLVAPEVPPPPPPRARERAIHFDSVDEIPPHTCVHVPSTVQDVFKGTRLTIPDDIAKRCSVEDIRVGSLSQMVGLLGMSGGIAAASAGGTPLDCTTAQVGQNVILTVTNTSDSPLRFRGTLLGLVPHEQN